MEQNFIDLWVEPDLTSSGEMTAFLESLGLKLNVRTGPQRTRNNEWDCYSWYIQLATPNRAFGLTYYTGLGKPVVHLEEVIESLILDSNYAGNEEMYFEMREIDEDSSEEEREQVESEYRVLCYNTSRFNALIEDLQRNTAVDLNDLLDRFV